MRVADQSTPYCVSPLPPMIVVAALIIVATMPTHYSQVLLHVTVTAIATVTIYTDFVAFTSPPICAPHPNHRKLIAPLYPPENHYYDQSC